MEHSGRVWEARSWELDRGKPIGWVNDRGKERVSCFICWLMEIENSKLGSRLCLCGGPDGQKIWITQLEVVSDQQMRFQ